MSRDLPSPFKQSEGREIMAGRLSFIEIGTPDLKVASKFLGQLFDWPFTPMGNADAGEGWFQTPGIRAGMHQEATPKLYVFFDVPDLAAAIDRVAELGGHAEKPSHEEPGFGKFCNCRTPDGLEFGLHQT
jgi:predicted enzyme related to lactoylglutathione lyase